MAPACHVRRRGGLAPLSEVPKNMSQMLTNVLGDMLYERRAAILVCAAAVAGVIRWRGDFLKELLSLGDGQVIIIMAVLFALSVAATEWVMKNGYDWRYWTVPVTLIFLVVASFLADSVYILLDAVTGSERVP